MIRNFDEISIEKLRINDRKHLEDVYKLLKKSLLKSFCDGDEEVFNDSFVYFISQINKYDSNKCKILTFIVNIIKRKKIDKYRILQAKNRISPQFIEKIKADDIFEDKLENDNITEKYEYILNLASEKEKKFIEFYLFGKTVKTGAQKVKYSRIIKKLKLIINEQKGKKRID